jgi:glycosyltransferase involved in cell wall biosynthesis
MRTVRRFGSFLYHYPQSCGTTFAARGLSSGLARLGHEVTFYCCGKCDERACSERDDQPNRKIMRFAPTNPRNPFHGPRTLLQRLSRNEDRLDLLLIHGNFCPRNVAVARAARKGRIPYILCPSGLYHREVFRKNPVRKIVYGALFERPILNGAVAVQVFMEAQKKVLAKFGVRTPVFVVPNGFDPAEIPPKPSESLEEDQTNPRFLYIGRIDMYTKGLDLLFEALATGIHEGKLSPDLRLDLVGPDWGDRAVLGQMANRLNIGSNIRFFGRVDDVMRWRVIFATDVMILTSRHDAFPTTVVEAMAAGKPVILSEETGASVYVREQQCGFLVKPDPRSICDGIIRAFSDRANWPQMGQRAQKFAYNHLVWDKVVENASEEYEKILRQL